MLRKVFNLRALCWLGHLGLIYFILFHLCSVSCRCWVRDEHVLCAFTFLSGLSLWLSLCRDQCQTVGLYIIAKVHSHEKIWKPLVVLMLHLMNVTNSFYFAAWSQWTHPDSTTTLSSLWTWTRVASIHSALLAFVYEQDFIMRCSTYWQ